MATPLVDLEGVLKVLGDRTRLRIVGLLLEGEICVCDIHQTLKAPQPKVSRHLAVLRKAGLVQTRRQGLWVQYRLADCADPRFASVADAVRQALAQMECIQRDASSLQQRGSSCAPRLSSSFAPRHPKGRPKQGRAMAPHSRRRRREY